ncbi:uncharacterized protein LOC111908413 [Lactuca sativa]|uniref:uncharacterized protein LOC111908413 n=1 Tax=Lactuca sativa TaxID=4236 RepID=UPI0022AF38BE|nr:uncharacterized protein LOC111908413 [Lactuca sativa]
MKQVAINKFFKRQLDVGDKNGERPKITSYNPNQGDEIRRAYLIKGPCQPVTLEFWPCTTNRPAVAPAVEEYKNNKSDASGLRTSLYSDSFSVNIAVAARLCGCSYRGYANHRPPPKGRVQQHDVYNILVDESSDVSKKQMAIVLRYVDKRGIVNERFVGVVYVLDTSSLTLKATIDIVFSNNNLSIVHVRGQCYDGVSNMSGAFNGLKSLILNENISAYYIHCFAHQLQLGVMTVTKKHDDVEEFFEKLAMVVTIICGSCKRKYMTREMQKERVTTEIEIVAFPKYIKEDVSTLSNRKQAKDTLSKHLPKEDQDILEATSLVKGTKEALLVFIKEEFPQIWKSVCVFFMKKHSIEIVDMSEDYVTPRKHMTNKTNQRHFEVVIFNTILNMQIQKFGDRFSEVGRKLIENMVALSPFDSFSSFCKAKLFKLSEIYKNDFDNFRKGAT